MTPTTMADLSLFQEEFKPGTGTDFNCVKSTQEIFQLIISQGLEKPDPKQLHEDLAKEGFEFVMADGVAMWKLKEIEP